MLTQTINKNGLVFSVYLNGRTVHFREWSETDDCIYYFPLSTLVDNGYATYDKDSCVVPFENIYLLSEDDKAILGVPPQYDKAIRLRGIGMLNTPEFKYKVDFLSHAPDGEILINEQCGNIVIINGKKYLFTHAGLMGSWVKRNKDAIGEPTVENLNRLMDSPKGIAALSDVSKYRTWFGEETGSILWSDLAEKVDDFDAETLKFTVEKDSIVKGYDYQIFGHTMLSKMPIITDNWACIDFKTAFILDDNNLLSIEEYEKEQTNKEQ